MSGQDLGIRIQNAGVRNESALLPSHQIEKKVGNEGVGKPEDTPALRAAKKAAQDDYDAKKDKLKKTTQDFEAIFLGMMLKQMRKSVAGENVLFGKSNESKMFQDMMDDTTAKNLSKAGSFGLANLLYKTMEHTLPPKPNK